MNAFLQSLTFSLKTSVLGRGDIEFHDSIGSTNARAKDLAAAGAPEGTLTTADAQTLGRGRLGRAWHSPPGRNLYFSLVLKPNLPPERTPLITLAAGLGVAEAIKKHTGLDIQIKWPNDLLIDGKKIVGILCEMEMQGPKVAFVILGIGINVNLALSDLTPEIAKTASSLMIASGKSWERPELLAEILYHVENNYLEIGRGSIQSILARYRKSCSTIDSLVGLPQGSEAVEGHALDIDENGELLVELLNTGEVITVSAGEVSLIKR